MARVSNGRPPQRPSTPQPSARPAAPRPSIPRAAKRRSKRTQPKPPLRTRIATWWRNAPISTAFSVYMVIYLVIAVAGCLVGITYLSGLRNQVGTNDQEAYGGLYLYDPDDGLLHEARQIKELVATAFYSADVVLDVMASYDELARESRSDQSGIPLTDLAFSSDAGLRVSPIGYYITAEMSAEAHITETALGVPSVLMVPLWLGACIYLAGRRFYAKRIKPAVKVFDAATAKIAQQDFDFTVAYDRADEMGRLVSSFENMRASLARTQRTLWRTAEEHRRLNAASSDPFLQALLSNPVTAPTP